MTSGFADLNQPILLTQTYLAVESVSEVVGTAEPVFPQVPHRPPRG